MSEQWDEIRPYCEGMACVKKDGKYGFINEQGELVIPCEYISARDFSEGFAAVSQDYYGSRYWDFVDKTGKCFHSKIWHWKWVWDFKGGVAKVAVDSERDLDDIIWKDIYCIDTTGAYISGPWDEIGDFYEGMARVLHRSEEDWEDAYYGFIDRSGVLVSPCQWDDAGDFDDGVAWVKKDDLYGAIDTEGKVITPCQWDEVFVWNNGFVEVKKHGKSGCVDISGTLVVPCEWESVVPELSGYFEVFKDNKFGLMNGQGELIIPCIWDYVGNEFYEGHVLVENNDKVGLVDETGKLVIPCEWDGIDFHFYGGRTEVIKDRMRGIVDVRCVFAPQGGSEKEGKVNSGKMAWTGPPAYENHLAVQYGKYQYCSGIGPRR